MWGRAIGRVLSWAALGAAVLVMAAPVSAQGRMGVLVTGEVESLPPTSDLVGRWKVAGVAVEVIPATLIVGREKVAVGVRVTVAGRAQQEGVITAAVVTVLQAPPEPWPQPFAGVVESLPAGGSLIGEWVVSGLVVEVTAATRVLDHARPVAVGVEVAGVGTPRPAGGVVADLVTVLPARPESPAEITALVLPLQATSAAPSGAEGVAVARLERRGDGTVHEDFKVGVAKLTPSSRLEVRVDGVVAGTILTNRWGAGALLLSTRRLPHVDPLPETLRPVTGLGLVHVLDSSGAELFVGHFRDARRWSPGEGERYAATALLENPLGAVVGVALVASHGERQELALTAWQLAPAQPLTVRADGRQVGVVVSDERGSLRARFAAPVGGEALPLPGELLPVSGWVTVELADAAGRVVAKGNLVSVGGSAGVRPLVRSSVRRR